LRWIWHTAEDVVPRLAEQAAAPFVEWGSQLEREIYRRYLLSTCGRGLRITVLEIRTASATTRSSISSPPI
jgi:hypothetical protein